MQKHELRLTLHDVKVHAPKELGADVAGFSAKENRNIISTVSLNKEYGAIYAPKEYHSALRSVVGSKYAILEFGQETKLALTQQQKPHGAITVHNSTVPLCCNNVQLESTADGSTAIVGDGTMGKLDHLSATYIPLVPVLAHAVRHGGHSTVQLETKNSSTGASTHEIHLGVGTSFNAVTFTDGVADSYEQDGVKIESKTRTGGAAGPGAHAVLSSKHIDTAFARNVRNLSAAPGTYLDNKVYTAQDALSKTVLKDFERRLTSQINACATANRSAAAAAGGTSGGATADEKEQNEPIDINELPPALQTQYSAASMLNLQQCYPIQAPTVIGANKDAGLGDNFNTCALMAQVNDRCARTHPAMGLKAVADGLFQQQINVDDAVAIVAPFVRHEKSPYAVCTQSDCSCAAAPQQVPPHNGHGHSRTAGGASRRDDVAGSIADAVESMLAGPVSMNTSKHAHARAHAPKKANATAADMGTACPCTGDSSTCKCTACTESRKMMHLANAVCSSWTTSQQATVYCGDQTMLCIDKNGVPVYTDTECVLPTHTLFNGARFGYVYGKKGTTNVPGNEGDAAGRIIGQVCHMDDCENKCMMAQRIHDTMHPVALQKHFPPEDFHVDQDPLTRGKPVSCAEHLKTAGVHKLGLETQRKLLYIAHAIGSAVEMHQGFLLTGSPTAANDQRGTAAPAAAAAGHVATARTPCPATAAMVQAFVGTACRAHRRNLRKGPALRTRTNDAAAEQGIGGHSTGVMKVEHELQANPYMFPTEGTANVVQGNGDRPWHVSYKATLGAADENDERAETGASNAAALTVDNQVKIDMTTTTAAAVGQIGGAVQVPGAVGRAPMFIGHNIKQSKPFYHELVTAGPYVMVQKGGKDTEIDAGAHAQTLMRKSLTPVITLDDVAANGGLQHVRKHMRDASCMLVKMVDTDAAEYKEHCNSMDAVHHALAPLTIPEQKIGERMRAINANYESLEVAFPDHDKLAAAASGKFMSFCSSYAPESVDPAQLAKLRTQLDRKCKRVNARHENVRFAAPVMAGSEFLVPWRLYGCPDNPLQGA